MDYPSGWITTGYMDMEDTPTVRTWQYTLEEIYPENTIHFRDMKLHDNNIRRAGYDKSRGYARTSFISDEGNIIKYDIDSMTLPEAVGENKDEMIVNMTEILLDGSKGREFVGILLGEFK
jgi:hypothetical protein